MSPLDILPFELVIAEQSEVIASFIATNSDLKEEVKSLTEEKVILRVWNLSKKFTRKSLFIFMKFVTKNNRKNLGSSLQ